MNRRRTVFASFIATAAFASGLPLAARATQAVKLEGYTFPGEITVKGFTLHLNGVGLRQVAWLKGYAAGLYLTVRSITQQEALTAPGPKRVSMRMLIDGPADEFAKAFMRGVSRNAPPGKLSSMQEGMQRFDGIIRRIGKLRKGDLIEVEWRPGEGTVALLNGKQREEAVPGEDIFVALLKIYIGDKPTDSKLKEGLLGGGSR
jgi:Chalcone isomerase-like